MSGQTSILGASEAPARTAARRQQAAASDRLNLLAGRHALLVLKRARDAVLTVRWGRVWFTVERDPGDYVLSAGERMRIASDRPVVLEAWSKSRLELEVPADSHLQIARAGGSLCLLDNDSLPSQLSRRPVPCER
jgi:hypothetical protein